MAHRVEVRLGGAAGLADSEPRAEAGQRPADAPADDAPLPSATRQLGEAFFADRLPALRRFQEPETRSSRYQRET